MKPIQILTVSKDQETNMVCTLKVKLNMERANTILETISQLIPNHLVGLETDPEYPNLCKGLNEYLTGIEELLLKALDAPEDTNV